MINGQKTSKRSSSDTHRVFKMVYMLSQFQARVNWSASILNLKFDIYNRPGIERAPLKTFQRKVLYIDILTHSTRTKRERT